MRAKRKEEGKETQQHNIHPERNGNVCVRVYAENNNGKEK